MCGLRAACVCGALGGVCLPGACLAYGAAVGNWHHCVCVKRQFPDDKGRASAGKRALKEGDSDPRLQQLPGTFRGYYRIAVRRREENERLLAALAQVTESSVVENGKEDKKPAAVPDGIEYVMPQEIEKRSFSIIEEELQLRGITLPVEEAMVTKRVIHTSADFSYAQTMTYSTGAVETAKWLITEGADIVTDTNMALSGINKARARTLRRIGTLLYGGRGCGKRGEGAGRYPRHREHGTGGKDRKTGHLLRSEMRRQL